MSDVTQLSRRSFMVMPLALAACKFGTDVFRIAGATMGTTYSVVALEGDRPVDEAELRAAIDGALAKVNRQMSNWDPASEISRFNARQGAAPTALSPELAEVMQAAEMVHAESGGRFDTTIGPLIELWGFGAPGAAETPSEAAIAAAQARSGHANSIELSGTAMRKVQPGAQIYLAAIGKGYGADRVGRALNALGISDYLVEIGGDLYASGRNPDGLAWRIGVETPADGRRDVMKVVGVTDHGLASSGDYRNFFLRDGKRFSHLVDPSTGRPVTHDTASVTVLAENAMLADAWATALHILGRKDGLALAEKKGLAALFTDRVVDGGAARFTSAASTAFKDLTA